MDAVTRAAEKRRGSDRFGLDRCFRLSAPLAGPAATVPPPFPQPLSSPSPRHLASFELPQAPMPIPWQL